MLAQSCVPLLSMMLEIIVHSTKLIAVSFTYQNVQCPFSLLVTKLLAEKRPAAVF